MLPSSAEEAPDPELIPGPGALINMKIAGIK